MNNEINEQENEITDEKINNFFGEKLVPHLLEAIVGIAEEVEVLDKKKASYLQRMVDEKEYCVFTPQWVKETAQEIYKAIHEKSPEGVPFILQKDALRQYARQYFRKEYRETNEYLAKVCEEKRELEAQLQALQQKYDDLSKKKAASKKTKP